MKERPILFSGPMVRAILEGRKTQTRRVVNLPCNVEHAEAELTRMQPGYEDGTRPIFGIDDEPNAFSVKCPYGAPGDRLWVKETHRFDGLDPKIDLRSQLLDDIVYRSDMDGDRSIDDCPWRPYIFMPRWASRITLEIVSVRVERLQDITEEDAIAEGCSPETRAEGTLFRGPIHPVKGTYKVYPCAKAAYRALWEFINGPGSWGVNPWVWVIQFRRVKP